MEIPRRKKSNAADLSPQNAAQGGTLCSDERRVSMYVKHNLKSLSLDRGYK